MKKQSNIFRLPVKFSADKLSGLFLSAVFFLMIVSGIFLFFSYIPHENQAFESIKKLQNYFLGRLFYNIHYIGTSLIFAGLYFQIFSAMARRLYIDKGNLYWISKIAVFLMFIAIAFSGNVLSYDYSAGWSAVVISGILEQIPLVGAIVSNFIMQEGYPGTDSLGGILYFHIFAVIAIALIIHLHIKIATAKYANSKKIDTLVRIERFFTVFFMFSVVIIAGLCAYAGGIIYEIASEEKFIPYEMVGEPITEWYLLPYYGVLKVVNFGFWFLDAKILGILLFSGIFGVLVFLPWLDFKSGKINSVLNFFIISFSFLCMGFAGYGELSDMITRLAGLSGISIFYIWFLVLMPLLTFPRKRIDFNDFEN